MIKRILQFVFAVTFCFSAHSQATGYNAIATAYVTTTISQIVVANSTMQQGGTFTFSVLAHNGGGRAGQSDTANVRIQFYNSGMGLMGTFQSSYNANLPIPNASAGNPAIDTTVPWSTLTVSTTVDAASAAGIAFVKISMYGIDGSYWAGDYGPWYRAPTFTLNGSGNLAYNPEFGPYNNVTAQGWTSSPGFGSCQGAWGGSNACIVNSDGVPGSSTAGLVANENGGGPSTSGGTTSGTAGGYNSTMTTTNAGTGATAGAPPPPPAAPTFDGTLTQTNNPANQTVTSGSGSSAGATTVQQTRVSTWQNGSASGNLITVDQTYGSNNDVRLEQNGSKNKIEFSLGGNGNVVRSTQTGVNNYLKEDIPGWGNTVTINQTNNVGYNYVETKIQGNGNTVNHTQNSNANQTLFSTITGDINTLTTTQSGTAAHYLETKMTGNFNNITATQSGSTSNKANIDVTNAGGAATVDLQQTGGRNFTIIQSCANPAGCTTTVRQ